MQCHYFDAGVCRSCTLMGQPHPTQVADKQAHVAGVLAGVAPDTRWLAPWSGRESGFRNKAKLVVSGTPDSPTLGIQGAEGYGVDLRECGLYEAPVSAAIPVVAQFISRAGLRPYDVSHRSGELKFVHLTGAPSGQLMIRFVLRSEGQLGKVRRELPWLMEQLPGLVVASVNLHPEHVASLEGQTEVMLTDAHTLPMDVAQVRLHLGVKSFFQTNTAAAAALYLQAREWVERVSPSSVLDLYCGVGGFALHAGAPGRMVTGVEVSADAIAAARRSADGAPGHRFVAGDATAYALGLEPADEPDLVIVNPPRRGIGETLATWLDASRVESVIYSSCNVDSLARDLARMPTWRVAEARLVDMFPQTRHHEVITRLERHPAASSTRPPSNTRTPSKSAR